MRPLFKILELVSIDYLDYAPNESILKKREQKPSFHARKLGIFWKSAKNHLTLTKCCDQTTAARVDVGRKGSLPSLALPSVLEGKARIYKEGSLPTLSLPFL